MTFTSRSRTRHRVTRALSAVLCLAGLALSACSGSSNSADPGPSEEGTPRATAEAPTIDHVGTPTPGADGSGTRHTAEAPTIGPSSSTPWTAPSLKFYNEDYSVWYQDDSVVNSDAVTDQGNIEGFRTYDGNCLGLEKRDISEVIHNNPLSDDAMSSALVDVKESNITDVNETGRDTVSLIRDDGGTMQGYTITWTGTYTAAGAEAQEVEGYKFARAVGDAGLNFSVMAMCRKGSGLSSDQWNTILGGVRIEGLSAGTMK